MKIAVVYDGAKHELPTFGPADFVAFERRFEKPASVLGEEGTARFEWLTFLVWRGLKKVGVINHETPFDDQFLDLIRSIDVGEEKDGDDDDESPAAAARSGSQPPGSAGRIPSLT